MEIENYIAGRFLFTLELSLQNYKSKDSKEPKKNGNYYNNSCCFKLISINS